MPSKIYNTKKSLGKHRGLISHEVVNRPAPVSRRKDDENICHQKGLAGPAQLPMTWSLPWINGFPLCCPDLCICELLSETGLDLVQLSHLKMFPSVKCWMGVIHSWTVRPRSVSFLFHNEEGTCAPWTKDSLPKCCVSRGTPCKARGPGGLACGGSVSVHAC